MNTLFTTGRTVPLSTTSTYTLKDNEVYVNNQLYYKKDLEVIHSGNKTDALQDNVKVGLKLRNDHKTIPATHKIYNQWSIDSKVQTSLSTLLENLNTAIL